MPDLVPGPPASAVTGPDTMAYDRPADLRVVRDFVGDRAAALGLPEMRAELLVLAVSELATNTLQHTDGGGRVRVWAQDGYVVCDVVDRGPAHGFGRQMPAADALRGRGLAIVERVCDAVEATPVPDGTLVRIRLRL
ncbi:ATP-binding protein [Couchioplanes caeruleus]|uniref:ATP-binding protein n=1 Tax=Couchioplanes caeruleus TaxID=56438 RepID=UPI0020BED7DC|nr:ATP-binding protein [Couchioplanes caeruleus]UQU62965.1 ATP-binding protein [Couchioplanes caeruleus]